MTRRISNWTIDSKEKDNAYLAGLLCLLLLPFFLPFGNCLLDLELVGKSLFPGTSAEVGESRRSLCLLGVLLAIIG